VTQARTFQVLGCEVSIATTCQTIADKLDYVAVRAEQHYPVSCRVSYRVELSDDAYQVWENGDRCYHDGNADRVLIELYRRMHALVYREMAGCSRLHAGCGAYEGMLFLTAGPKGVGKSTLMTRLLFDGFAVFGDEMVLGFGDQVIALPRPFHVKAPALDLLPEVAALANRLPFVMGDGGFKILAFDPTDAGLPWAIRPGRPAAIFFLQPNHQGATTVERCSKVGMMQFLMPQSTHHGDDGGVWIRSIGTLVRGAECHILRVGDLSSAADVMRTALRSAVSCNATLGVAN
jgi:hypothetical protein